MVCSKNAYISLWWATMLITLRSTQSLIIIGSDDTLAQAPDWMGFQRGPLIYFLGPYLFRYYKAEFNV